MITKLNTKLKNLCRIARDIRRISNIDNELQLLKNRVDVQSGLFTALEGERRSDGYASRYCKSDPLVSICIATYNRGELLCERAIGSLLTQTHQNIEVIVVGDHYTDDTEVRIAKIRDDRLRFVNLPERGNYPSDPIRRWAVAGTVPMNVGLTMAEGDFVTHLDDDDRHAPDRIETLLSQLREDSLEVVFHPFRFEDDQGRWRVNTAEDFSRGCVTTSSVMYDRFFARIPWDIDAHLLSEPGDWNRFRKFAFLGARIGRSPQILLDHFKERNQRH